MKLGTDTTQRRAEAYHVLSLCYHAPDDHLLDVLRETSLLRLGGLPPLIELQKDYAHLFVGPFKVPAPPYGSVYLEDNERVCGDSTMEVIARYNEEGLRLTLAEPADHVAIELEYMHLLIFRQMRAVASGDEDSATGYLEKQRDFLENHLGPWMPLLTEKIAENAGTDFYRQVAAATDDFIRQDLDACSNRMTSSLCS